jgi:UDP-glucose 4-epimerase
MRILITGGFGFLGGNLAKYISKTTTGHEVILGSRRLYNNPEWLPQVDVVNIQWANEMALEQICEGVDIVIHAAGMNAQDCVNDPKSALEFNGYSTEKLISASKSQRVKQFVYFSTAHVYASPLIGTITEETLPYNPHPYATSHLAGERSVFLAHENGELEGIVLRLSNAIGAPVNRDVNCWMLLVNDLCKQVVETRKMVLRTSGVQQRDFISVNEVCRAVAHLIFFKQNYFQDNCLYNIGSGVSKSIFEVAKLVQENCKVVLNIDPVIERPLSGIKEVHEFLDFRVDKLIGTKFNISTDLNPAIRELLIFCKSNFP